MSRVRRADNALNEFIEELDHHFAIHKENKVMAFQSLTRAENRFIDQEIHFCIESPRYYFENYHCIRTESEGITTLYPIWDSQEILMAEINYLYNLGRQARLIILKARQLGISTLSQGFIFHRTIFTEGVNSLIVAQDPGQAAYLFDMSRLAYDMLPWWMRPEERYNKKGQYLQFDKKSDLERQRNPGLQSAIFVEAANKLSGISVGKTIRNAHLSEISDWGPDAGHILATQIEPTMNAPDLLAIMESTARGKQGLWWRFWKASIEGKTDWHPVFIEFFRVRKYSLPLDPGEKFTRTPEEVSITESVQRETGFAITDGALKWRRKKIENTIGQTGDEWMFYQEYPINWREAFQASGQCAFDKKKLHQLQTTTACPPKWYGEIDLNRNDKRVKLKLKVTERGKECPAQESPRYALHVWEAPASNEEYYIGGDVAHGLQGGDFSVAQVMRKAKKAYEPDVQVAEWRGWINPTSFAYVLAALGYWYGIAEIACETNDIGRLVNNELFRVIEYPKIFQWKHYDKVKNFMTDFFGWQTTHKTRPEIIAKFDEAIDDSTLVLRSENLIDEAMSFSSINGSRFEGQETNDDALFAMMICYYCVSPETKTLTSDLKWVTIGECKKGDRLIAFDEDIRDSHIRESVVTSHKVIYQPRFEVVTDKGTVIATLNHAWAARTGGVRKGFDRNWLTTKELKPGDKIFFLAKPWEQDLRPESQWLAGLLDGEGCITFGHKRKPNSHSGIGRGRISFGQKDGLVLSKALSICKKIGLKTRFSRNNAPGVRIIDLRVDSPYSALEIVGRLQPIRLVENLKKQWTGNPYIRFHWPTPVATVKTIRPLGIGPVVAVGTTTRTLFTEGLASHNCAHDLDWGKPREGPNAAPQRDPYQDYANSEFSPVWDNPHGMRHDMVVKRKVPAEALMYEDMDPGRSVTTDEDRWKML